MEQIENIARTYTQAPWRKQLQFIILFSLGVVLVAIVAGVYLNISARSTAVGRDIQEMQVEIANYNRENEDLQSQLARILSANQMESRAQDLNFESVPSDQIVYLVVPDYSEREPIVLAPSTVRSAVRAVSMPPEYTESIFTWLARNARDWYLTVIEEMP
jgi:cell division protein FtsL